MVFQWPLMHVKDLAGGPVSSCQLIYINSWQFANFVAQVFFLCASLLKLCTFHVYTISVTYLFALLQYIVWLGFGDVLFNNLNMSITCNLILEVLCITIFVSGIYQTPFQFSVSF